jgi:HNH endonuclease
MVNSDLISHDKIIEYLDYEPDTGIFRWKKTSASKGPKGSIAGTMTKSGYLQIGFCGIVVRAHRLAWFYVHKKWPSHVIDHIDGNKLNNRIDNLRDVNLTINQLNIHKASKNSMLKIRGVSLNRNKYIAYFKRKNLGRFETWQEAEIAYLRAKGQLIAETVEGPTA